MGLSIIFTLYFKYFFILKYVNYCCKDSKKLLGQKNVCITAYIFNFCPGKDPVLYREAGLHKG